MTRQWRETAPTLFQGLACAALSPGLRSVLLLDIPPPAVERVGRALSRMIEAATDRETRCLTLSSVHTDDDLWGSLQPGPDAAGRLSVSWSVGLLPESPFDQRTLLAVIPDLARLSLAAARACVTLMDSPVANLERHGRSARYRPDICWLAGCARGELGRVSPHLLDRWALRLRWPSLDSSGKIDEIAEWLASPDATEHGVPLDLPETVLDALQEAVHRDVPTITAGAVERVMGHIPTTDGYSVRRDITLGRLARCVARLWGESSVTPDHVDMAAQLIGLRSPVPRADSGTGDAEEPPTPPPASINSPVTPRIPGGAISGGGSAAGGESLPSARDVRRPDASDVLKPLKLEAGTIATPAEAYGEDASTVQHEATPLQFPLAHRRGSYAPYGQVIGTQRAYRFEDISPVGTLLEAMKFQRIRRQNRGVADNRLLLSPADLRSYRRAPAPEQSLVLVLDYTSLDDLPWQEAIVPGLRWAYVHRAAICVIGVGAANAGNYLRAQRVEARSILVPAIGAALEAGAGRATPLAHGLDLAFQMLQRSLQRGRNAARHAMLVVATDGRGNVPLEASRLGRVSGPVDRDGVEDAMQIARRISTLRDVERVLLDPQPSHHAELPAALARAMQAVVVPIGATSAGGPENPS